jgi:hypothetical protein
MVNEDLSHIVLGHTDYAAKIDEILIHLGYAEEFETHDDLRRTVSSYNLREKEKIHKRTPSFDSFNPKYHKHVDIISDLKADPNNKDKDVSN